MNESDLLSLTASLASSPPSVENPAPEHEDLEGTVKAATKMECHGPSENMTRSTRQYGDFIQALKDPRAANVLNSIKRFVARFLSEIPAEEGEQLDVETLGEANKQGKAFQIFMSSLELQMRNNMCFRPENDNDWDDTTEAAEKFVLKKVHLGCFRVTARQRKLDEKLRRKIQSLSFLTAKHLQVSDFSEENLAQWTKAGAELSRMNTFMGAREKMTCILKCGKKISELLCSSNENGMTGADVLFPAFIFVVLKENPKDLFSNVDFIASFRAPARMRGSAAYFFTLLTSAVGYISRLDCKSLSISQEDFESGLAITQEKIDGESDFSFGWLGLKDIPQRKLTLMEKISNVIGNSEDWKEKHFEFRGKSVEEMTISELKRMHQHYENLARVVDAVLRN